MSKKDFLKWFVGKMEEAWQSCKKGHAIRIPPCYVSVLPEPLRREVERRGLLLLNKLGLFSSRKRAFQVGFCEGWSLALSEEGYRLIRSLHGRKRRRRRDEEIGRRGTQERT